MMKDLKTFDDVLVCLKNGKNLTLSDQYISLGLVLYTKYNAKCTREQLIFASTLLLEHGKKNNSSTHEIIDEMLSTISNFPHSHSWYKEFQSFYNKRFGHE